MLVVVFVSDAAMSPIPIVRAAHLLLYIDALRELGEPVDRDLAASRLPGWIEERPEAYVSLPLTLDWVAKSNRNVSLPELGYLAARKMSLATVDPMMEMAVLSAPTTYARIGVISHLAHREDSALVIRARTEGSNIRIICDMPDFRGTPFFGFAEWLNLGGIAFLVGAGAGPAWHPEEMTFVCPSPQCDAALDTFGRTRILSGQTYSSLLVTSEVLAKSNLLLADAEGTQPPLAEIANEWDFVSTLRSVLRPYVGGQAPTLALAAEISGMSGRTLQRRLARSGLSYSQVLEQTRFEIARDMLAVRDAKIVDVAMASGYENPQHFSRAFRRIAGMAPKTYRRMAADIV